MRLIEVDVLETERASLAGRAALLHTVSHHRREGKRYAKRGLAKIAELPESDRSMAVKKAVS